MWRRFKTASRASHILYWDCPSKCGTLHKIDLAIKLPYLYKCFCGLTYQILKITNLTQNSARLLLEVENEI